VTSKKAPAWSTALSGKFFANAAWLGCAVLAHNLTRWTARLGSIHPNDQLTVTRTVRARVLALPGRIVNRSGRTVLRLPERWPWATTFTRALDQIRSLPLTT
jgi:Transposase DDE domain group 1